MRLFGNKETPQEQLARLARDAQSQKSLESGGLPTASMERLQKQAHDPKRRFVSDLSVNELLLTRLNGYEPLGQVMGSSVYHVGWQFSPFYSSGELGTLTHAHWHARMLALSRLQHEARLLKAHGVVGVRLDTNTYDWGNHLIEFAVMGTAIRIPDEPPVDHPFLSDMSGQDFWAIRSAGFFPVGFAFGNCVWYEMATWATMMATDPTATGYGYGYNANTSFLNQELTDFTQGLYTARHMAMTRLTSECQTMGASGVIGTDIKMEMQEIERDLGNDQHRTDMIIHFTAMGTAIVEADSEKKPQIDYGVSLGDPVQSAY